MTDDGAGLMAAGVAYGRRLAGLPPPREGVGAC